MYKKPLLLCKRLRDRPLPGLTDLNNKPLMAKSTSWSAGYLAVVSLGVQDEDVCCLNTKIFFLILWTWIAITAETTRSALRFNAGGLATGDTSAPLDLASPEMIHGPLHVLKSVSWISTGDVCRGLLLELQRMTSASCSEYILGQNVRRLSPSSGLQC